MIELGISLLVLIVLAGGISSLVLRIFLIEIMDLNSNLFKESGQPRTLFLSDTLPLRAFRARDQLNGKHVAFVWIVFLLWIFFLAAIILLIILCMWIFSRR